jgi:hypothetical protein
MVLRLVQSKRSWPLVQRFGKEWGVTADYLFNWIVGFETKEDAELVSEALQSTSDNLRDSMWES